MPGSDGAVRFASETLTPLAAETLAPPVGYSGWWLVLAVVLVAAVSLFLAWVLWHTRTRGPRGPSAGDLATLRTACLAGIDDVVARSRTGVLSTRSAHQELAGLVRGFARDASPSGRDQAAMSLAELAAAGSPLTGLIGGYYGPEFGTDDAGDPLLAADAARRLVSSWR